ncbi:hypothetical protein, partial [Ralstonia pickettii]|uniref:hypothetical protein n=1 Tax=Ralstonia pickettii TaxID=329 RepID=UPI001C535D44
ASLRCLQQRNEIMQSFFVAVNNSSKNFYPSTRCQLPLDLLSITYHPIDRKPAPHLPLHHSTPPPPLAFRRCVLQRGANTNARKRGWQALL